MTKGLLYDRYPLRLKKTTMDKLYKNQI